MYMTILKIIQPYLMRYLAKSAAGYLTQRREQRLKKGENETPTPLPKAIDCPPPQTRLSPANIFWYTISGVLLGSAFGFILAYLLKPEDTDS